jgi:hypothetical protein
MATNDLSNIYKKKKIYQSLEFLTYACQRLLLYPAVTDAFPVDAEKS